MGQGVDILDAVKSPTDVKNAGYGFIGRYPSTLSTTEVKDISDAGLYIVSIKEGGGSSKSTTTYANGQTDGQNAESAYKSLGMPSGSPIYFAIDWTGTSADNQTILDYFEGIVAGMTGYYKIGMYGENEFCQYIYDNYSEVTYFWGTAGFSPSPLSFMALWQYTTQTTIDGQVFDTDESNGDAGGWQNTNP